MSSPHLPGNVPGIATVKSHHHDTHAQSTTSHLTPILVAFSGGLDSTVLLHQLVQWRTENPGVTLRAIHVHHGLSANADAWVTHCENVCQQWQVPLVVERVQLAQEGLGIEAQARQARYQAFARTHCPAKCWSPRNISTINVKPFCWR
ncbi:ATP-binding protein [Escherichia coli]